MIRMIMFMIRMIGFAIYPKFGQNFARVTIRWKCPQVALGCRVIVGVRNPDAVRKVFEDCGDAVQARIPIVKQKYTDQGVISGFAAGPSFNGKCAKLCKTGEQKLVLHFPFKFPIFKCLRCFNWASLWMCWLTMQASCLDQGRRLQRSQYIEFKSKWRKGASNSCYNVLFSKNLYFGRGLSTSFVPTILVTSSSPTSYYLSSSNLERVASLQDW